MNDNVVRQSSMQVMKDSNFEAFSNLFMKKNVQNPMNA